MSDVFADLISGAQPRELIATQTALYAADGTALQVDSSSKIGVSLYGGSAAPADTVIGAVADQADSVSNLINGIAASSFGYGFNGTSWDRLRSEGNDRDAIAVSTLGCLQTLNFQHVFDPDLGSWNRVRGAGDDAIADGQTVAANSVGFNGTGMDRWRNNTEGTLLASAARTAQVNSATQTNYNHRGVLVYVVVTADPGTASITPRIQVPDPVGGTFIATPWVAAAPITAIGTYTYLIYPGATGGDYTEAVGVALPRTWRFQMNVADAESMTYSVGYSLIL